MFNATEVASLANAARKGLSRARPPAVKGRSAPMDGTALGALMATLGDDRSGLTLTRREAICFSQSFEHVPDRRTVAWFDAATAVHYSVVPMRTLRTSDGHFCREYTAKATLNGHAADVYGTACRQSDGRWVLID
jgi:surface antigen